jgi:hypothetical protein
VAASTITFRVFVSSTFSDLKAERNALQDRVFPRLRELCLARGARFQAIDLRWGVSEEASLDQQTMRICLGEIARCQQVSPRPNFIVLLGDRYGWRPLPEEIPATEFREIERRIAGRDAKALLDKWYRRDDNALPPLYLLRGREGKYEDYETWEVQVERPLRSALLEATAAMELPEEARLKYEASATHQEIVAGALGVEDAPEHVFCFFRSIEGLPQDERAKDFLDLDADGKPDEDARQHQQRLKAELSERLPGNIREYQAGWNGEGTTADHLEHLCEDVYQSLSQVILQQLAQMEAVEPLEAEIAAHEAFGHERARHFVGRAGILQTIGRYVDGKSNQPLAIWGESGTGKSALMAKAVLEAQEAHPEAEVVCRFVGATPESSSGRALLEGLCREISRRYLVDESTVPFDYKGLGADFCERIALARPERPLILAIDALDQFGAGELARGLDWLPAVLPPDVRVVVSTLPGDCLAALEARLPSESLLQLGPMEPDQAGHLLDLWLADAGRTLQAQQRAAILEAFGREDNRLPLYLRLAFEESRRWRSYATPGETALGSDVSGLIGSLFARLSAEANHGEILVSRTLGYLAAARNGLAEDELIDLLSRDVDLYASFLGRLYHTPPDLLAWVRKRLDDIAAGPSEGGEREPVDDRAAEEWISDLRRDQRELMAYLSTVLPNPDGPRLPIVLWSRLYFDLEPYLTSRAAAGSALLGFYHRQLGDVAAERYLAGGDQAQIHARLAAYFRSKADPAGEGMWTGEYPRGLSETPYHQYHGGLTDDLVDTVADLRFVDAMCGAFSPQAMLDQLELGLAAARERSNELYAIPVLAAWGYAVSKSLIRDRAVALLEESRVGEALRIVRHAQPAAQASNLLTELAHHALEGRRLSQAKEILQAILISRLPIAPADLGSRLQMVDRFVQQETWEALHSLPADRPSVSAAHVLLYMMGTTQWSDRLAEELALTSGSLTSPYWQGVCLLYLACRAARLGLSVAPDVAGRLGTVISHMPDSKERLSLQEATGRCARWLVPAGLSMEQLGLPEGMGGAREAVPSPVSPPVHRPPASQHGHFRFLSARQAAAPGVDSADVGMDLRAALGALADAAGRECLWQAEELAARLSRHVEESSESAATDSAERLYWGSLIDERSPRSPAVPPVEPSYDLARESQPRRVQLLASLARLGRQEPLRASLEAWIGRVAASREEADVYRTVRALTHWKSADGFLRSASERLRASSQSPGPSPEVIVELVRGLLRWRCLDEGAYWIGYLLNYVAPKMGFSAAAPPGASPPRRDAYALLAQALPPAPSADDPATLRRAATDSAERLDRDRPELSAAMRRELRTQASPLPYLADRILAFWVEENGWREPDGEVTLVRFTDLLQLGLVNDDRERLRSWFFWLLVLSSDPTPAQLEDWKQGVRGAYAPPEPHEDAVRQLLEARESGDWSKLDVLKAIAAQLGEGYHPPAVVGELSDAVMRGFTDPVEQAEGLSVVAEACVRLGQDADAAAFAATAEALAPGSELLARARIRVARLARETGPDSLGQWPDAGTFHEAYHASLERSSRQGDAEPLLALIGFIASAPDSWSELLIALCRSLRDPGEAAAAGAALLEAIERLEDNQAQEGRSE